jgi:hypothetical protein
MAVVHDQVEGRGEGETQGGAGVRLPLRLHTLGTKSSQVFLVRRVVSCCVHTLPVFSSYLLVLQCRVDVHSILPCVLPNNPTNNTTRVKMSRCQDVNETFDLRKKEI